MKASTAGPERGERGIGHRAQGNEIEVIDHARLRQALPYKPMRLPQRSTQC